MLHDALGKLTTAGNTRARALLKLTTVECSATRYEEALRILNDNKALFQKLINPTTKGSYHSERAIILWSLATGEKRHDYLRQAVSEYERADNQFRLARNVVYRADVKNNIGLLLFKFARYKEAHKYLDEARRLTLTFKRQSPYRADR